VRRLAVALAGIWRERLGQGDDTRRPLRIPFVDFARGDGVEIGPGCANTWTPNLIDETTPWVSKYRGLWGLFARDPISGENAPAGPMYDRGGTPRPSWFDPLGFAGLDQVTPPPRAQQVAEAELERLHRRETELDLEIAQSTEALREVGARLDSMRGSPHLANTAAALELETAGLAAALTSLRREKSENVAVIEGLRRRIATLESGTPDDPRAHIRHTVAPVPESKLRFDHAAEVWATISISLLLVGLAILLVVSPGNAWAEGIVLVMAAVIGESALRGTFKRTINRIGVILALIALGVLVVQFANAIFVALLIALAVYLLYQRIQEYRA
jgi:hypothetical protein